MTMDDDVEIRERVFHNAVREYVIWLLLFVLLYVSSYVILCAYRRRTDKEDCYSDKEDALVYRISLWLCTFTLAVSGGAVLLLPVSIVANEALHSFPNSYYLKWVNSSLIHGLWIQISLTSNLCLFVLMPFAYLFTESEGFSGSRKGIMSRVYETAVVLFLLAILVCGLAWVASALLDGDQFSRDTLFDVWKFYLPYLYSRVSLLGAVMLLLCTPLGFARMFTVIGELVLKPKFLRNLDDEIQMVRFEEASLCRRLEENTSHKRIANGHMTSDELKLMLDETQKERLELEKQQKTWSVRRNLGYPLVMLLLLMLTGISVIMVTQNSFELLIGIRTLPVGTKEMMLGIASLSILGPVGACLEISLILYLMLACVVGFYSLPGFRRLKPRLHDTSMTQTIGNCVVLLILSSALPVLSRILGLTNFDLLGNFGQLEWLGNFYIVLSYNLVFAVAATLCLVTKFTSSMRAELLHRLEQVFGGIRRGTAVSSSHAISKEE